MATVFIKVTRGGEPVKGARVTIGEGLKEFTTGINGIISRTVPEDWGPMVVLIMVEGEGFTMGGGPYKLERDKELVLEV